MDAGIVSRAQGAWLGQLAGDALGSQVEFSSASEIASAYPDGVRELRDGGYWNTIAGQPTDDSEMATMLARMLVRNKRYVAQDAFNEYQFWLNSGPFDVGGTIRAGLQGRLSFFSQANGAMMRVSPIGIFGATLDLNAVAVMARADAALTHPHPVCVDANALFAMAIAASSGQKMSPQDVYEKICGWAIEMNVDGALLRAVLQARVCPPENPRDKQGWVLIAFQNALHRLLHAASFESGVVETVMMGGDTDTNAAIAGAMLGAVYGRDAIPGNWVDCLLSCRPEAGSPGVARPRPEVFWPVDALELAEDLVYAGHFSLSEANRYKV